MDAEDEQLLEDEVAVPTDSKRSVVCMQLVVQSVPYQELMSFTVSHITHITDLYSNYKSIEMLVMVLGYNFRVPNC